jgi:HK97 family phage major capsid protein
MMTPQTEFKWDKMPGDWTVEKNGRVSLPSSVLKALLRIIGLGPKEDEPHLAGFLHAVSKARAIGSTPKERDHYSGVLKAWGSEWVNKPVEKAALLESSGQLGGYTVPRQMSLVLLKTLAEKSILYQRCLRVEMTSREIELPTVDTSNTGTAGTSPFFGGMAFQWGVVQGAALPETEPKFALDRLVSWSLEGYLKLSNQFLADAGPEAETLLVEIMARAAAWQAEYAFLRGTGADGLMPLGMLNANACINVTRTIAAQVAAEDIANMAAALMPECWRNAIWVCNPTCLEDIVSVSGFQLNQGIITSDGSIGILANRPLYPTEKLPTIGNLGDLMLVDPSMYVLGIRQEVVVDADPHSAFQNNQTFFRVWLRIGGQPWLNSPVTLADGTTSASSIIALK